MMGARIPDSVINDVLANTNIVNVIGSRVELKKHGRNYSCCCPFHSESTPSFNVSESKQLFNCFGCGEGGNVIRFLMNIEKISFPEAVRQLAGECGIEVPPADDKPVDSEASERQDNMHKAVSFAAKRFAGELTKPEAKKYIEKRGISSTAIQKYGLGFAPDGFEFITGSTRDQWIEINKSVGLITESEKKPGTHYDFFRNRLMFPIRTPRGRIVAFAGRSLADGAKSKYINSPESEIFSKQRILYGLYESLQANKDLESLIVVEGYLDVIGLSDIGVSNAVAAMGTAFTEHHAELLFKHTSNVIFVFDGDKAGRNAAINAARCIAPFLYDGRSASFVLLPDGEDPDSLAHTNRDALLKLIAEPECLSEFLIKQACDLCAGSSTPAARSKACIFLKSFVCEMPYGFLREFFISDMAAAFGLEAGVARMLLLHDQA